MKKLLVIVWSFALPTLASAADKALILNDQEQAAFRELLDVAVKAQGIQLAPNVVYLMNKLNSAPNVTERKETVSTVEPSSELPSAEGDKK